jgi:hypothetical protein
MPIISRFPARWTVLPDARSCLSRPAATCARGGKTASGNLPGGFHGPTIFKGVGTPVRRGRRDRPTRYSATSSRSYSPTIIRDRRSLRTPRSLSLSGVVGRNLRARGHRPARPREIPCDFVPTLPELSARLSPVQMAGNDGTQISGFVSMMVNGVRWSLPGRSTENPGVQDPQRRHASRSTACRWWAGLRCEYRCVITSVLCPRISFTV